ncbi:protein kinase [Brasilonema sp. UFV-L1]|nr:protein kinase [Brasilonema sp. UFV-L1]
MPAQIDSGNLINSRYQIQKVLGQGGFGRTYLAFDTQRFGDSCVLKEFVVSGTAEDIAQKSRELFEREAKVLHYLNHPQIPKFLAWFTEQERLFIVQEYIYGQTYSQVFQERLSQQNQAFSEAEVIQLVMDLLPVLDYLHELKVIHRDISLENVMLPNDQSKPVLIDFGLVKEKVSQIWSVGTVLGKIGYAPPEQLRVGKSYPSSDLYALGVCAIVLLTGKMPDLLMDESLEWQWRSYVNISESFASILDKMLAEKPTQRYQSAKEILDALQPLSLPNETKVSEPLKKLQINIDQAKKEQQVAEIIESEEFKLLEQQALRLRQTTEDNSELQFEAQTPEHSTPSSQMMIAQPAEVVVAPEPAPEPASEAKIPAPVNPHFVEHCRQELNRSIGSLASVILEEIFTKFPQITSEQLIEKLAAEISNPQSAQEFRNRIKIHSKSHSNSSVTHDSEVASAHSSPLPPTIVVQPVTQQGNSTPPATSDSTLVQQVTARLIHIQTDKQIELPRNLSVIRIGKPNKSISPDVDLSKFPNSQVVSRIHAHIRVEGNGFYIEDVGSSNGTYINNLRLLPGDRYRLRSGDCISLGRRNLVTFLFQIF